MQLFQPEKALLRAPGMVVWAAPGTDYETALGVAAGREVVAAEELVVVVRLLCMRGVQLWAERIPLLPSHCHRRTPRHVPDWLPRTRMSVTWRPLDAARQTVAAAGSTWEQQLVADVHMMALPVVVAVD